MKLEQITGDELQRRIFNVLPPSWQKSICGGGRITMWDGESGIRLEIWKAEKRGKKGKVRRGQAKK